MSFTDQIRRIATEADTKASWSGVKNGERFRCYLCGYKFQIGDGWRWVCANDLYFETSNGKKYGCRNFLVCDVCDGPDVLQKWKERNQEYRQVMQNRFWALHNEN